MKLLATVSELNAANAETAKALESLALMEVRATTAEENLKTASASVVALTAERDAALASLKEQSASIVAAQEKINALETAAKGFELKVAAVAASTVASLGHEPVKVSIKSDARPDFSNLKGLDRSIAAHKFKSSATN